jgi:hypothetical protein
LDVAGALALSAVACSLGALDPAFCVAADDLDVAVADLIVAAAGLDDAVVADLGVAVAVFNCAIVVGGAHGKYSGGELLKAVMECTRVRGDLSGKSTSLGGS